VLGLISLVSCVTVLAINGLLLTVISTDFAGVDIKEFPNVKAWLDRMLARPAVVKGLESPKKVNLEELGKDPEKFKSYLSTNLQWIKQGMDENARL
jgi:glutathione S-transferase